MFRLIVRRGAGSLIVLLLLSLIVYGVFDIVPGDPAAAIAGDNATTEQVEAIRQRLGLDRPFVERYGEWLQSAVQGDLGTSMFSSISVQEAVQTRLHVTASLFLWSLLIVLVVAVPAGMVAGSKPHGWVDRIGGAVASAGLSMPVFWVGALAILLFARQLGWLPSGGYIPLSESPLEWALHLLLPAGVLAFAGSADVFRQSRAATRGVLAEEYSRTAVAMGATPHQLLLNHAARNAMVPITTVVGLQLARMVGVTVLIEQLFGMRGVGKLVAESVIRNDITMVQGVTIYVAVFVLAVTLLVDISYSWFNPKVLTAA